MRMEYDFMVWEGYRLSSVLGFWSLITFLVYGIIIALVILVIYTLLLAIKALKIYIQKNS
ncbi:MAG: hypothetical protein K0R34_4049 [Herbinix sp.]|nr:hypothetical protein [Herbinix sp.]